MMSVNYATTIETIIVLGNILFVKTKLKLCVTDKNETICAM